MRFLERLHENLTPLSTPSFSILLPSMEIPNATTSCTSDLEIKPAQSTDREIWPPETSNNDASADLRRTRRRRRKKTCNGGGGEITDEKSEVERKIEALQGIVPGGESLPVELLFEETAEYILALERQVKTLRFLSAFLQSSQKKARMLGG